MPLIRINTGFSPIFIPETLPNEIIMNHPQKTGTLLSSIKEIILKAKQAAFKSNNSILLNTYWEIGRLIVEDKQRGAAKAARRFYLAFQIRDAARHELSWTHGLKKYLIVFYTLL